ncbi:DUF4139 domain-containing protein, partial [Streptomyces sp. NPDC042898]|uniref:DUF4139 domain-containing protein n=1 Tax=Streptomyces sp. NPDC042898 TaxID=3154334 RepID=UPI0033E4FBD8
MVAGAGQRWGSTLDAVVVYAQGAVCLRLARGVVPSDGRIRVTGLPRSLDPASLRARVRGAAGVRVTEARVEVEAELAGTGAPDELRREVERLRDVYEAAHGRRARQEARVKEVQALRPVTPARKRDDPHRRTPVDAWLELAEFVDGRLTGLHARLVELEEALRVAEHELTVAADRLDRASTDAPSAHVETSVCAVLTLDGAAADAGDAEVEVEVEYGVPGAVWVPTYRLHHRQGDGTGRLVLRASVAQRTGEDWTGVRVALATADLRRRTDLPRLRSIRVGRRQAAPAPSGWREPPAGLADLFSGYDAAGPRPAVEGSAVGGSAVGGWSDVAVGSAPPPPPAPSAPQGYGGAPEAFGGGMPAATGLPPGMAAPSGPPPAAPRPSAPRSEDRRRSGTDCHVRPAPDGRPADGRPLDGRTR